MYQSFRKDPFPGKPRILFIGLAQSSHTHSWISLLSDADLNLRLFAMPGGLPPSDWGVKTYISGLYLGKNSKLHQYYCAGAGGKLKYVYNKITRRIGQPPTGASIWLANVIKRWKPDIIHTFGLFDDQGGQFYFQTRRRFHLEGHAKWVLQLRGGSDIALRRYHPEYRDIIQKSFAECDQIVCDNQANVKYGCEMGVPREKFAPIIPVPGSGGIEITEETLETTRPSKRERLILWPKAYEARWSKALPVLSAIQTAWDRIKPCEVYMLASTPDVYDWYLAMPDEIRKHCHISERIPRNQVLSLMKRARILLAPSLIDGVPNSLYEAMAYGAFPIVSPLETITPIVRQEENVLFARNLYPDEIAFCLERAMNDDYLVDKAAINNLRLVGEIADRQAIRRNVISFYNDLLAG